MSKISFREDGVTTDREIRLPPKNDYCNLKQKTITAPTPNFDFVLDYLMERTNRICKMIESLGVRPVFTQRKMIAVGGKGTMFPLTPTFYHAFWVKPRNWLNRYLYNLARLTGTPAGFLATPANFVSIFVESTSTSDNETYRLANQAIIVTPKQKFIRQPHYVSFCAHVSGPVPNAV